MNEPTDETTEDGWTIHIENEGQHLDTLPEEHIDDFVELLARHGGAVSFSEDSYGATLSVRERDGVDTDDPQSAIDVGLRIFRGAAKQAGLPDLPIVVLEAKTFIEHDKELDRPVIPELVSVSEIADLLGVSRQRAHQLTKRADFPKPIAQLAAGPIWTRPSLNLFVERWRGDKFDYAQQLAIADAMLAQVRDMRNRLAHGDPSASTVELLEQWVEQTARIVSIDGQARMAAAMSAADEMVEVAAAAILEMADGALARGVTNEAILVDPSPALEPADD